MPRATARAASPTSSCRTTTPDRCAVPCAGCTRSGGGRKASWCGRCRERSSTWRWTSGKWESARLSAENFRQLFIPEGFAHGFCVLSEIAEVEYKCTAFYDREDEIGARWDSAGIDWPIAQPLLSPKDAALPTLAELRRMLES